MHLLSRSLPVLLGQTGCELDVRILNNDPSQDVRAWLESTFAEKDRARIRVVDMGFDAGFARAMNHGISTSEGDFVLLCNADLFPAIDYIDRMLAFFAAHPQAGLATGKILRYDFLTNRQTGTIDSTGLFIGRNRRFIARGEGERDAGQFAEEEEVFGVDGAALFARRAALESIAIEGEYFDESFFMYKEDWDLSWRVRLAGWQCWYVPSAVAFHGRTSRGLGEMGYLSAIKLFYENEKAKPSLVRFHSLKNQWLMLLKNEDIMNFVRDSPFILAREILVLGYNVVFAPRTLLAIGEFLKLSPLALAKRRVIKERQAVRPAEIRRWLSGSNGNFVGKRAFEAIPPDGSEMHHEGPSP